MNRQSPYFGEALEKARRMLREDPDGARRLLEESRAQREQRSEDYSPDRMPVGELSPHLDPTLRWGGSSPYNFLQNEPPAPPAPGFLYLTSNLLAQAKVGRPRTWTVLMQMQFDAGSEWAGSAGSDWLVNFQLLIGAGQVNIALNQYFSGAPATGMTRAGDASPQPPFATLTAFWEAVPAAEINAQVIVSGNQTGSPAPFTGLVSAICSPYYPLER